MTDPKLTPSQRKVLRALANYYDSYGDGFCYVGFGPLARKTRLPRNQVRRAARALARKGLAHFSRGLFNEDGEVAGSGYGCTRAGAEALKS